MRIYYCGHAETDAITLLANVGAGKKVKRCGATAYNRCGCGSRHPDVANAPGKAGFADHPKYLCEEHLEIYAT